MTNGTTQGLFILLAIVIFGIFVLISYMLYQDKMKTGLTAIMCDAMTITSKNTGFELPDKDCTATFPNDENDNGNSEIPTGLQYYKIRNSNEERNESEVWVLIEHEQDNPNTVRIIDSGDRDGFALETFGANLDGIISFPDKIEQWNITHIDKHSFEQAKFSEIMKLPDELLVLDDYSLKQSVFSGEATFPEHLEIIGIQALRDSKFTKGLDSLTNVREIREDAFKESEFTDSDLSNLGKNADELVLAEGSLGKYRPEGTFKLPSNISRIGGGSSGLNTNGHGVFDTSGITRIDFTGVNDLKEIGDGAFKEAKITGSLKLPTTVESIGQNAFEQSNITELDLSDNKNLEVIGDNAFKNSKITKLVIPKDSKLKEIGKEAFKEAELTQLDLREAKELENIDDGAFENARLTGNLVLPSSIKRIGDRAFYTAIFTNPQWITPTKLEYIGDYAFYNSEMQGQLILTMSKGLKYIGNYSFYNSYKTTLIDGVGIAYYRENLDNFYKRAEYLTKMTLNLPDSVEYIGNSAFYNAGFWGWFTIPKETKYIGDSAFYNSYAYYSIIQNSEGRNGSIFLYRDSYSIQSRFLFNENIEYIGSDAFYKAHFKDESDVIPRKLNTIGNNAFKHSFGTTKKELTERNSSNKSYKIYYYSTTTATYNKQKIKVGRALKTHNLENILVVD